MSHFVLFLEAEHRPITNVELIASMGVAEIPGGPIYAEGIDGFRYQIELAAFNDPALFHDVQSAQNAIHYLRYEKDVDESSFKILPYTASMNLDPPGPSDSGTGFCRGTTSGPTQTERSD